MVGILNSKQIGKQLLYYRYVCFSPPPGNSECQFYVWIIVAFLGLALVVSLIFNISHYVEKLRQGKTF